MIIKRSKWMYVAVCTDCNSICDFNLEHAPCPECGNYKHPDPDGKYGHKIGMSVQYETHLSWKWPFVSRKIKYRKTNV